LALKEGRGGIKIKERRRESKRGRREARGEVQNGSSVTV